MKERQILFSGPMVGAIRDGRKTQTRRPVKGVALEMLQPDNFTPEYVALPENDLSPYGYAGDHPWVKETFFAYGRWETRYSAKKVRDEWHFIDMTIECDRAYQYAADDPDVPLSNNRVGVLPGWWKRPAIFMPRAASRITLEVTGARVERLQEIDWEDSIAEGIRDPRRAAWRVDPVEGCVAKYRELWDSLNAARGYGWHANPWVWVVEFRRIEA
jgi:hypothetical protein